MSNNFRLDQNIIRWVLNQINSQAEIHSIQKLIGSTSSTLYHLSVLMKEEQKNYVIRLFDQKDWVKEEPDLALHEAESLQYADEMNTPTPEIIAFDEHGKECGTPLVLMTFLKGSVQLEPQDMNKWIDQLAKTLVNIHQLDEKKFGWEYSPYQNIHQFDVPKWSSVPHLWEKAIQIVKRPQPQDKFCFIHRDYHPANILWQDGEISGVVDWVNACRGPAGVDIGHCRVNLALLYGAKVADLFLKSYEEHAQAKQHEQTYWDLRSVIDISFGPPTVYLGWEAFGVTGLTDQLMEERLDLYMESLFPLF